MVFSQSNSWLRLLFILYSIVYGLDFSCFQLLSISDYDLLQGAEIDVRSIVVGDETMSVLEIWGAEYQEQVCWGYSLGDFMCIVIIPFFL